MRTKALVLAAALAAGTALTSMAQTVYSINAVGYVNLTIPAGFSMIANPLNTTNNTVGTLFPTVPEFTIVYKWTGTTYDSATYAFGSWDKPNVTLNPGEGCFIFNPEAAFTNTFVGEVVQSPNATTPLTNSLPAGFSIRSSIVPQEGSQDTLNITPTAGDFDIIYTYGTGGYTSYTYAFGSWDRTATIKVGEAFWYYNAGTAKNWTRTFTVNE